MMEKATEDIHIKASPEVLEMLREWKGPLRIRAVNDPILGWTFEFKEEWAFQRDLENGGNK